MRESGLAKPLHEALPKAGEEKTPYGFPDRAPVLPVRAGRTCRVLPLGRDTGRDHGNQQLPRPNPAPPASSADDAGAEIATPPPLNAIPASAPPTPPLRQTARAEGMTSKRIRFAPGTSSAIEEGSITGYDSVDYLLASRPGKA